MLETGTENFNIKAKQMYSSSLRAILLFGAAELLNIHVDLIILYIIELMLHVSPALFCDFIIQTNAQAPHF